MAPPLSSVGYCPVIPVPSTQLDTVYTLLKKSVLMAQALGKKDAVVVVYQAIYAKALEVIWKKPVELAKLKLKTFSSKSVKGHAKSKNEVLKADKSFFTRLVVLAQSCCIDVATVLQYPLGPLPSTVLQYPLGPLPWA